MANDVTSTEPAFQPFPIFVPPLESGDHLTRDEFERRYEAMPHIKKAELIEGEVHMPSAVRWNPHARPHANLLGWLTYYRGSTAGAQVGTNATIRLDLENEFQPDGALIVEPAFGGKVKISSDGYIEGGPELAAEISASTASIDLNTKLRVYRRNNVLEYIVWRVLDQAIDWFRLRHGQYERLPLNSAGHYQSEVFPGLWLDPAAMMRGDLATVFQVLQQGLASPQHAEFVANLQKQASPTKA